MEPKFKLISANSIELFEERLHNFVGSLARDDLIVDLKFATTAMGNLVEFSVLVHYQSTESWE